MIIEVKNFSNKALKDIMIENFYKKIVLQTINTTPATEFTNEAIRKIRSEIKDFFTALHKQSVIMKNLGYVISAYFDRNSLISFDDIMETVSIYNNFIFIFKSNKNKIKFFPVYCTKYKRFIIFDSLIFLFSKIESTNF